ncbi:hypothetical protein SAMN04488505_10554 [Chitinophaga rupis]|jgi:hypothetical protein|uniref:Uncharacterized protein n=1 Tax=Chitinophaga rupis TaxID=573321 RepID=A0A1H7ZES9_9BACT|nr:MULTISPECIES: hypothetical protein [Chitinophaga]SEM56504.1 hypothetical protein SAMN04488505_10554 [Chitinophaga rupis]
MKESIEAKLLALTKKAKENGANLKGSGAIRNGSSLHKIIKTKEQAATFMKLLQSL